jgi:hypothetical protein
VIDSVLRVAIGGSSLIERLLGTLLFERLGVPVNISENGNGASRPEAEALRAAIRKGRENGKVNG